MGGNVSSPEFAAASSDSSEVVIDPAPIEEYGPLSVVETGSSLLTDQL